jgi:hypothetical protein
LTLNLILQINHLVIIPASHLQSKMSCAALDLQKVWDAFIRRTCATLPVVVLMLSVMGMFSFTTSPVQSKVCGYSQLD